MATHWGEAPERRTARKGRSPILAFVGRFLALLAVFLIASHSGILESTTFKAYLGINATVTALLLGLLGYDVAAVGNVLVSTEFSLQVIRGCDSVEPSAIFAAAVVAYSPATWRARLCGVAAGCTALAVVNVARVAALFLTGVHSPDAFDRVHLELLPSLFVVASLVLWLLWVRTMTSYPAAGS